MEKYSPNFQKEMANLSLMHYNAKTLLLIEFYIHNRKTFAN